MPSAVPAAIANTNAVPVNSNVAGRPLHDQRDHRPLLAMRKPEITRRDMAHIDPQLLVQRQVEAELVTQLFEELRIGGTRLAGDDARRVAGRRVDQQEIYDNDGEDDGDHLGQAKDKKS